MANIQSQKKRNRQNEKHRLSNKAVRSDLRTRLKKVETASAEGDAEQVVELSQDAQKALGVAVRKGVMHKNTAARQQARLSRLVSAARSS